jgi:hypothetical protein
MNEIDPSRCPICGQPNDCAVVAQNGHKGPCWCHTIKIPHEILQLVPEEARGKACLCRRCATGGAYAYAAGLHSRVRPEQV